MRYVNARNTAFGEDRRSYKETDSGVSSTQRVFNVSYDNGRVEAYLNGVRLFPDEDYTKTSSGIGTSITLASDLGSNNVLEIVGYQGINSGNALVEDNFVVGTGSTGSGGSYTNSTTVFPVASSVGDTVSVWRNGVKLVPTTDYTVSVSAQTVTLGSAASSADEITVQVVGGVIHNNGLTVNSGSNSFFLPTTRGADGYVLTRDNSIGTGGTTWTETITAPTISNITGEINEDTTTTLTVTGSGFSSGMTLKLINVSGGADISGHTELSYSGSSSPLTVTIPTGTTGIAAGTQVKLNINKQGLSVTSTQVITVSEDPNWSTSAGTLATINETLGASQTVGTLSASAGSGGGTIVYSSASSDHGADALDSTYFSLNSSSGVITTTSTALTGLTSSSNFTESFKANAKIQGSESTKNTLLSGINIIIQKEPTSSNSGSGSSSVGVVSTYSGYKVYLWTSVGTHTGSFVLYYDKAVDILLVAGGGGGGASFSAGGRGGGGGAGGYRLLTSTSLVAGTYNIKVGHGGAGGSYTGAVGRFGAAGGDSYVELSGSTQYKANGGGGGGGVDNAGFAGGSGGGGGSYGGGGRSGGSGNEGGFTPAEGNNGGTSSGSASAGGGGGATGTGTNNGSPAAGGAGATTNIRDGSTDVTYSAGGTGASSSPSVGGVSTGNGGGGHSGGSGQEGGSGIVLIRYAI